MKPPTDELERGGAYERGGRGETGGVGEVEGEKETEGSLLHLHVGTLTETRLDTVI